MQIIRFLVACFVCLCGADLALAEIKIGVVASLSGPAALIGTAQKNTVSMFPTNIGGVKVEYIILDDAGDPKQALASLRKLQDELKVDAVLGPSTVPSAEVMVNAMENSNTPLLMTVVSASLGSPVSEGYKWTFKTTQSDELLADKLIVHMQWNRVNTLGFIGFNDVYGKNWHKIINRKAGKAFIDITASMGFDRTDSSVSEQVARIISTRPDAVLVAASGEPALVPQFALRDMGYKGLIYQTHGVASSEFIRLGGKRVEGVLVASDPVLVADDLSKGNPVKLVAQAYVQDYEKRFGAGSASAYGARIFDAGLLLQSAIPRALKKAVPGSLQFRQALRDELEQIRELTGTQGVFRMSPLDHNGMDRRSCVIMKVQNGRWVLVK